MIGQHPAMYGLPEINLFAADRLDELLELFARKPGLRHGLLRAVAELGLGEQSAGAARAARDWLASNRTLATHDLYADLAAWAHPLRLVDKSPIYALRPDSLERIERSVLDARYLHLTRHPAAVMASVARFRARLGRSGAPARAQRGADAQLERYWLEPHRAIVRFLDGVSSSRWMRMRGEDLLAEPETQLRKIAAWLGIDDGRLAIAAMMHPEASPYACEGPAGARFGNDPDFLKSPSLRPPSTAPPDPLHDPSPAVADYARRLGYTLSGSAMRRSEPPTS